MADDSYSVAVFAHNEDANIVELINNIFENSCSRLNRLLVIANGCRDHTVQRVQELQAHHTKLQLLELDLGDKCNAWNEYVYNWIDVSNVHFFVDADVHFSSQAFSLMSTHLVESSEAVAIAGLPFSGRNQNYYRSLVEEKQCLFGNLYGLKSSFIGHIRAKQFKLPIGLMWIDSALTKMINRNVSNHYEKDSKRIVHHPQCGYSFDSLKWYYPRDIRTYHERIVRYELGRMQEKYLNELEFSQWPPSCQEINMKIHSDLCVGRSKVKWYLMNFVKRRCIRL